MVEALSFKINVSALCLNRQKINERLISLILVKKEQGKVFKGEIYLTETKIKEEQFFTDLL